MILNYALTFVERVNDNVGDATMALRRALTKSILLMGLGWLIFAGFITGLITGIVAIIFTEILVYLERYSFFYLGIPYLGETRIDISVLNKVAEGIEPYRIIVLYSLATLLNGLLVYLLAPEAQGHGTDAAVKAIHHKWGHTEPKIPPVKLASSAIYVGLGGSAGSEGPLVQSGSGIGALIGSLLGADRYLRRILAIAGIGGAIGAAFRAPLGGSIFAIEVLYRRDYESEAFVPSLVAAITGYTVYSVYTGFKPLFSLGGVHVKALDVAIAALVGVLIVPVAYLYVKTFHYVHRVMSKLFPNLFVRILVGGLTAGIVAMIIVYAEPISVLALFGRGYEMVNVMVSVKLGIAVLLVSIIGKILTSSLGVASGNSGGVFAPMIVIGALTGVLTGTIFADYLHVPVSSPAFYAVIGMSAMIAAAAKVPLTAIVMTSDMVGGNWMIPASGIASVVAYILSGMELTIYKSQLLNRYRSFVKPW